MRISVIKQIVRKIFFRIRPRRLKLLCQGVKFSGSLRGFGKVRIFKGRNICLSDNVLLGHEVTLKSIGGKISIGKNTVINDYSYINSATSIEIGENVLIAPFCHITDRNHGFAASELIIKQKGTSTPIYIGDDVWIGSGVKILEGATIGNGSIIGANSVVNRNIPPFSIAVGAPARVIKERT